MGVKLQTFRDMKKVFFGIPSKKGKIQMQHPDFMIIIF